MARVYDLEVSMLLPERQFDPKAVTVLKDSFVALGILPERPNDINFSVRLFCRMCIEVSLTS
jgi:hypothetical protein